MSLILPRTRLRPNETAVLWDHAGALDVHGLTLRAGAAEHPLTGAGVARRGIQRWDWQLHGAFTVPTDTPAGDYHLYLRGDDTGVVVTVLPPRVFTRITTLKPTRQDAEEIERHLRADDVELRPGLYRLSRPIRMTERHNLVGYGAVLQREWEPHSYANHIFQPAADVAIEGVTIQWSPDAPAGAARYVFKDTSDVQQPIHNVTLRSCVFQGRDSAGTALGEWDRPGALAVDCRFNSVSAAAVTGPCAFLRCRFTGPTADGANAWSTWGARGIAMIDCDFVSTDRGPVLQANRQAIRDLLFSGTVCRGLTHQVNGCEAWGCEARAGPIERVLMLHTRVESESCAPLMWSADCRDWLIRDFTIVSPQGIWLAAGSPGCEDARQTDIVFRDGVIDGGGVMLGQGTARVRFENVYRTPPRPSLGNQFGGELWLIGVHDAGSDNDLAGLRQIDVSGGVGPVRVERPVPVPID